MKELEKLFALLPDNLSEASKNGVIEFIKQGINDAQTKWEEQMTEKENAIAEAKKTIAELQDSMSTSQSQVEALTQEIEGLKQEAEARDLAAKYQDRMSMIKNEFDLTEAETERVAKKARELDDEAFTEWYEDFSTFAYTKKKSVIEATNNEHNEKIKTLQDRIAELEESKSEAPKLNDTTDDKGASDTEEALNNIKEEEGQSVANAQTPSNSEPTFEEQLKAFRDSVVIEKK